jgi:hypothetical protein
VLNSHYEGVWESGSTAPPLLTSALDGGELPASSLWRVTHGTPLDGRLGGLGAGRDAVGEQKHSPCRNSVVQPVDQLLY